MTPVPHSAARKVSASSDQPRLVRSLIYSLQKTVFWLLADELGVINIHSFDCELVSVAVDGVDGLK